MNKFSRVAASAALVLGLAALGAPLASAAPVADVVASVQTEPDVTADVNAAVDAVVDLDLGLCIRIGDIIVIGCKPCPDEVRPEPEFP